MNILLANYRYFVSGSPERYLFNVTDALAARDVIQWITESRAYLLRALGVPKTREK